MKFKIVGRPEKQSLSPTQSIGKKAAVVKPFHDIRYDPQDHFSNVNEMREKFRYCPSGHKNIYCRKWNVV